MRAFLAAALLALAGCSTTSYQESPTEIRVGFGGGGQVAAKQRTYRAFAASGKRVVIDGQVISADALLAFAVPGACYTENAVWSPHAISALGLFPLPDRTAHYAARLPPALRDWFLAHPSSRDWIGFPRLDYADLLRIWPEGACAPPAS